MLDEFHMRAAQHAATVGALLRLVCPIPLPFRRQPSVAFENGPLEWLGVIIGMATGPDRARKFRQPRHARRIRRKRTPEEHVTIDMNERFGLKAVGVEFSERPP